MHELTTPLLLTSITLLGMAFSFLLGYYHAKARFTKEIL
mgnify:CR=1 FL=1